MKRKTTKLEQQLLDKGWRLTSKHYIGKHSDKVLYYTYEKQFIDTIKAVEGEDEKVFHHAKVKLDSTRTDIYEISVKNNFGEYISQIMIMFELKYIAKIEDEVRACYQNSLDKHEDSELSEEEQGENND